MTDFIAGSATRVSPALTVDLAESLLDRVRQRQARVAIIGLGYVGLPLAVAFAEAGFPVTGIDINEARVKAVQRGDSYVQDVAAQRLASLTQKLSATTDYGVLHEADAVIVCVPTPLSKTRDPDLSFIISAVDQIARHLHSGMLVVLESTTYPGTTEEVILPALQKAGGQDFKVGRDFFLAFSPERIDPGRKDWTLNNTPKVIGGVTPQCLRVASELYQCIVREVVPVSSPKVAEMSKLLENTFRATNIALVNEIAIMCDRLGLDVWEVIEAASTKPFGFMPFFPGPGLGGHCIPIDPHYLAWKLRNMDYNPRFIQLASEINLGMPAYVLGKVSDALNEDGKPLKDSRVMVLGVTYKADMADLRDSPALDLIRLLKNKGAKVAYHDPYIPQLQVDDLSLVRTELDQAGLKEVDCIVIATDHHEYDWQWIVANSRLIVDTRNAIKGIPANQTRVVKL